MPPKWRWISCSLTPAVWATSRPRSAAPARVGRGAPCARSGDLLRRRPARPCRPTGARRVTRRGRSCAAPGRAIGSPSRSAGRRPQGGDQGRFLHLAPDQHHPDRAAVDQAAGNGEGRVPGKVERAGVLLHVEGEVEAGSLVAAKGKVGVARISTCSSASSLAALTIGGERLDLRRARRPDRDPLRSFLLAAALRARRSRRGRRARRSSPCRPPRAGPRWPRRRARRPRAAPPAGGSHRPPS